MIARLLWRTWACCHRPRPTPSQVVATRVMRGMQVAPEQAGTNLLSALTADMEQLLAYSWRASLSRMEAGFCRSVQLYKVALLEGDHEDFAVFGFYWGSGQACWRLP